MKRKLTLIQLNICDVVENSNETLNKMRQIEAVLNVYSNKYKKTYRRPCEHESAADVFLATWRG